MASKRIVFCCGHCNVPIVFDSEAHDHCITKDDETWFCVDCREFCVDKCASCKCNLSEDDEKYWCNYREEYICDDCIEAAEKCDDEECDCCHGGGD